MSQFPSFGQFGHRRGAGTPMQEALVLELFTDAFVETRQGSCWIEGDTAWLLEPDERREFTARAQEIIAQRFALEHRAKIGVMIVAPPTFLLLRFVLGTVLHLPDPWPLGIAIGAVVMLAFAASLTVWWQDRQLAQLRGRMRLRMRGRDSLPAKTIETRKFRNPWLVLMQVLVVLTLVATVAVGVLSQGDFAADWGLPPVWSEPDAIERLATPWLMGAVALVWVLFGFSRIRRWRNRRKEARLAEDRRLAEVTLPIDGEVELDPLDEGFDPAAFDRLVAETSPPRRA